MLYDGEFMVILIMTDSYSEFGVLMVDADVAVADAFGLQNIISMAESAVLESTEESELNVLHELLVDVTEVLLTELLSVTKYVT